MSPLAGPAVGQSYALFPVSGGDVAGTVAALQVAFRSQGGGALANLVRVVPMQAVNSVLVIANQPSYIEDARRVFTLVERGRRQSVRTWHVYYLQNSGRAAVRTNRPGRGPRACEVGPAAPAA